MKSIAYTLTSDEIYTALKKSGDYHNNKRTLIETIILLAFFLYFTVEFILNPTGYFSLIMAIVCAVFGFLSFYLPIREMKKLSEEGSKDITMTVSDEKVSVRNGEASYELLLDKSSKLIVSDGLYIIKTPDKKIIVLPERAIPEGDKKLIADPIVNGTANK
jgi:hypothetical protein